MAWLLPASPYTVFHNISFLLYTPAYPAPVSFSYILHPLEAGDLYPSDEDGSPSAMFAVMPLACAYIRQVLCEHFLLVCL